jgi:membrane associated rhomboid family serine protease
MELFCPKCESPLGHDLSVSGAAWQCRFHHGRTVGMGPLRALLDDGIASHMWRQAASAPASPKSCPGCAKVMAAVTAPGESGVVDLDLCRRCHIAWIDEGEWEQLPRRPRPPTAELPERAAEILGAAERHRVQPDDAWPQMWLWQWVAGILRLPARDDGRPVTLMPVTVGVGLLMVIATIAAAIYGLDEAVARFGLIPADPDRLGGLTLFTSFFLHGGVVHLLGNLYFLIVIGSAVERRIGSWRTAMVLLASLATALVVHMALDPRPAVPVVGASGGIAGLLVLFVFAFPAVPFQILVVQLPIVRWFRVSAATLGGLLLAYNVVGAVLQLGGWGGVSSLAHLGGAGAGVVFWLAWRGEIKRAQRLAEVVNRRGRRLATERATSS